MGYFTLRLIIEISVLSCGRDSNRERERETTGKFWTVFASEVKNSSFLLTGRITLRFLSDCNSSQESEPDSRIKALATAGKLPQGTPATISPWWLPPLAEKTIYMKHHAIS